MNSSKEKVYIFHSDPGHGWLAVKRHELETLGLANKITPYSYQRGKTVYLEEDQDAYTFMEAYKARHGVALTHRESFQESTAIRSYKSYEPDSPDSKTGLFYN